MKVADLFVNLGIKGADTAQKAIKGVKGNLEELGSQGLAAKAAVVGLFYGLERLTSFAGQRGQDLRQFAAYTGESAEMLQKWQYSLGPLGASAEEVQGAIEGIQGAMANMRITGQAPQGLLNLVQAMHLSDEDLRHPFKILEAAQAFTKLGDTATNNQLAGWMGGRNVIASLRQFQGNANDVPAGSILSDKSQEALQRVNQQWFRLYNTLKMIGYGMVASNGGWAIDEMSKAIHFVERLNKALDTFTGKKTLFIEACVLIGAAVYAAFGPLGPVLAGLGLALAEMEKLSEGKANIFTKLGMTPEKFKDAAVANPNFGNKNFEKDQWNDWPGLRGIMKNLLPDPPYLKSPQDKEKAPEIHLKQEFHGAADPTQVQRAAMDGVKEAYRQFSTVTQNA